MEYFYREKGTVLSLEDLIRQSIREVIRSNVNPLMNSEFKGESTTFSESYSCKAPGYSSLLEASFGKSILAKLEGPGKVPGTSSIPINKNPKKSKTGNIVQPYSAPVLEPRPSMSKEDEERPIAKLSALRSRIERDFSRYYFRTYQLINESFEDELVTQLTSDNRLFSGDIDDISKEDLAITLYLMYHVGELGSELPGADKSNNLNRLAAKSMQYSGLVKTSSKA